MKFKIIEFGDGKFSVKRKRRFFYSKVRETDRGGSFVWTRCNSLQEAESLCVKFYNRLQRKRLEKKVVNRYDLELD